MTDGARYLPLLALTIPLLGAGVLTVWPPRERFAPFERPLFLGALALSLAVLVAAGLGRTLVAQFPFWGEPFLLGRTLAFTMDYLSLVCALLLIGSLLFVALLERPDEALREAAVVALFVGGAGVAVLLAANMATLCLAWVFSTWRSCGSTRATPRAPARWAPSATCSCAPPRRSPSSPPPSSSWPNRGMRPSRSSRPRARPPALMATALLRIGLYPLPGGLERTWLAYLVSATTGGYLWLRLASLSVERAARRRMAPPGGRDRAALDRRPGGPLGEELPGGLPPLPLVGPPGVGAPCPGVRRRPRRPGRRGEHRPGRGAARRRGGGVRRGLAWRLPALVRALAAGGGPLTVGFLARWAFLRVAWEEGHTGLFAVAVAAFALASVPAWRQASLAPAPPETAGDGAPPAPDAASERPAARIAALVGGYLPAVVLVVGGTAPALLGAIGARLISRFSLPLAEGYGAVSWAGAPAYAAAAALLVLAVGYVLARGIAGGRPSPARLTAHTFLEMDWLYSSAERTLAWTEAAIARGAAVIEEGPAALGWILLWLLAGLFLLTGR